jgi:CxxC motif-containing protein (DUF1111 family)
MYYTHKIITAVFFSLVVVFITFQSCKKTPQDLHETDLNEWYSGGKQTVFVTGSSAFSQSFIELTSEKQALHEFGDALFGTTFNSDNTQRNHGLGPIFNSQSCISCHVGDGRTRAPMPGEPLGPVLIRINMPGQNEYGESNPVPGFGIQIQQRGIFGVLGEADVNVSYTENIYQFPDGEAYKLREPLYTITNPYTPLPSGMLVSARMPRPVFGFGLLEAIPESDILSKADENDSNNDGISGKPNYVYDMSSHAMRLGRIGWKATQPSLIQQASFGFTEDISVTNFILPAENSFGQSQDDHKNDDTELGDSALYAVSYYLKTLAVPGRRNADDATVKNGKKIFTQIGCIKCHVSMQKTGVDVAFPELSNQTIFPYTDLLLHNMGAGLDDGRPDHQALGYEWRTPPLWGIGLTNTVNGHTNFLHDGRARNLTEAIMWHSGEAENAKSEFKNSSKSDRDALIKFLNSL